MALSDVDHHRGADEGRFMNTARSVKLQCPACLREWTVEVEEIQPGLLTMPRFGCAADGMTPMEVETGPDFWAGRTSPTSRLEPETS